jgi:hypothetical protein
VSVMRLAPHSIDSSRNRLNATNDKLDEHSETRPGSSVLLMGGAVEPERTTLPVDGLPTTRKEK